MSETMRERVARAIRDKAREIMRAKLSSGEYAVAEAEAMYCADKLADAALDAMREPTKVMMEIGRAADWDSPLPRRDKSLRIYEAMIDAAKGGS